MAHPAKASPLAPAYAFVIDHLIQLGARSGEVLDYGCGSGDLLGAGRAQGVNMVGADVFFGGSHARQDIADLLGDMAFEMIDGQLPFVDHRFDIVVVNQVFEHVEDIDLALSEIRRVLKPGGVLFALFPSIGVLREGHCGIALAHWLNGAPRLQRAWLACGHAMGLGYHRAAKSRSEWAADFSEWLRLYTVYRRYNELRRTFARHFGAIRHVEREIAVFRLAARPRLKAFAGTRMGGAIASTAIRRLGTMAIELR